MKPHRIEIYEGPDSRGRYHYALFWMTDYHPGHPDGEYRHAERGQHFFSTLSRAASLGTKVKHRWNS